MSSTPGGPTWSGPPTLPMRGVSQRAALLAGGLLSRSWRWCCSRTPSGAPRRRACLGPRSSDAWGLDRAAAMDGCRRVRRPARRLVRRVMTVNGATLPSMQTTGALPVAMAIVPLGNADWDGMSIEARTSAPATFVLFNGTSQQLVRPTAKDQLPSHGAALGRFDGLRDPVFVGLGDDQARAARSFSTSGCGR